MGIAQHSRGFLKWAALAVIASAFAAPPGRADIMLTGTIRDFRRGDMPGGHPDFQTMFGVDLGIVQTMLGADKKPVYAGMPTTPTTTGAANFNQWYNDVPGVNLSIGHTITLMETVPGIFVFGSSAFFPIDGLLFGNEGLIHNYHFTYELHNQFTYQGGETFTFTGDDDVWVFINNRLAINLGGVHAALTASVNLDAAALLGITPGNNYDFDLFFAERQTVDSNFFITTSIVLGGSVPEPSTFALLSLGAAGLLGYAWRRRRRA